MRDSKKRSVMTIRKSTTDFPTIAYVTPSLQKGGSKSDFCCLNKFQFQSNKVCYKVRKTSSGKIVVGL